MNLKDIFLLILTSSLIIIASVVFADEKDAAAEISQVEVVLVDSASNDDDSVVVPEKKSVISAKLDINKATEEELISLTGIGPALAERIIVYRNSNGPFNSIDELVNVKGIGVKKVAILKNEAKIN